jgi:hypothetical protein
VILVQNGLPFGQHTCDVHVGAIVQANGQLDGLRSCGAFVADPEADPFDVAALGLSQDFASAM